MSADAIVSTAMMLEGMSYGRNRQLYCDTLYPHDNKQQASEMGASQSSCGLTCMAILRMAEVDGTISWKGETRDWLRMPYARMLGAAIAMPFALARSHGAWVDAIHHDISGELPSPGDMVIIGGSLPGRWGGVEHILTVTGRDGRWLESIDGGRVDTDNRGRCTSIERVLRHIIEVPDHNELWLTKPGISLNKDGRPAEGRRLQGWIQAGNLPCVVAK